MKSISTFLDRLSLLHTMISVPSAENAQAAVIIWAVQTVYAERPNSFRCHPADTLTFRAVMALEQRSTVETVDILQNVRIHGLSRDIEELRRYLTLHRDRLSHPFLQHWRTHEKQEFASSGKEWLDIRAAYIRKLQTEMARELVSNGQLPVAHDISVNGEMASLVYSILFSSASKELSDAFIPTEQIIRSLDRFKVAFYDFCATHTNTSGRA